LTDVNDPEVQKVPAAQYHGRKTATAAEASKCLHLYDRLEQSAHPVTLENDRIIPLNDLLALAS
jgi:hypothetical protein